jgi:antirestriction protein ArdC
MNCPNGHGQLVKVDELHHECATCGYSFAEKKITGTKYTDEVNEIIKGMLMEARLGDEPVPWKKTWVLCNKMNYDSKRQYNGLNRLLLSCDAEDLYITEQSIREKHNLTKPVDVKGRVIINWITPKLTKEEKAKCHTPEELKKSLAKKYPYMITHTVYRAKDIPGLPPKQVVESKDNKRFDNIEDFVKSLTWLKMEEGGSSAHYIPSQDLIQVPRIERYESSEAYYQVLFHELVHATGHKDRLNRDLNTFHFGEEYGREELVAEIGAAYLCHYFNIPVTENDVAYIDGWMKKIDADARLLVSASQQAEKVFKYLGLTGEEEAE